MPYWDTPPNIPAAAEFGMSILRHQSIHNESIVVAPYLLAYIIYMGAVRSTGTKATLVFDTIWSRGNLDDMTYAPINGQIIPQENANFTIMNFIYTKWSFDKKKHSIVENPVTVEEELEKHNNDFSRNTDGRIERLYNPADLEDITFVTSLVCNFKASWRNRFDPSETFEGTFHTSEGSKRNVTFLSIPGAVRKYSENDHFEILSLPYDSEWYETKYNKTQSLSMNIILPKTRFGLAAALQKTNIWAFQALLTNTEDTYIKATIPKFDIDAPFNFKRYFKSEGLEALIAKPPPKDEETVKEEWKAFSLSRKVADLPELNYVFGSAMTIGMDEDGSHINDINPEFSTNLTSVHEDTIRKKIKQKTIIADHPFAFVVLCEEHPVFFGAHF